jgi:hypothetical protein
VTLFLALTLVNEAITQDAPPTGLFPEQAYLTGNLPTEFVLKDFNHDGYIDLVTSNNTNYLSFITFAGVK